MFKEFYENYENLEKSKDNFIYYLYQNGVLQEKDNLLSLVELYDATAVIKTLKGFCPKLNSKILYQKYEQILKYYIRVCADQAPQQNLLTEKDIAEIITMMDNNSKEK